MFSPYNSYDAAAEKGSGGGGEYTAPASSQAQGKAGVATPWGTAPPRLRASHTPINSVATSCMMPTILCCRPLQFDWIRKAFISLNWQ